ncbi:hypothetical protein [Methanopyrus sp. SNP6]|uniref:hypothetical protein n=1 Tax=Methanopyrus sp. SNP6 TaxID=1937005 RepID=UPI00143969BD|nr:hypothetical protein [Methanopyrus sp. SNP6]
MAVEWEFVRAMECAITLATVRLFGERGNATRRVMARIMCSTKIYLTIHGRR